MNLIYILLLLILRSLFVLGQNHEDIIKYKEISALQNKRDSFEIAYNYCKLPSLQKQILKLDKKLAKEKQKNMKLLTRVDSSLTIAYHLGNSLYELGQYDLALPILSHIMILCNENIQVKSIDYNKATSHLAMIYTKSDKYKNQDSAVYYLNRSIDLGNQDVDVLITYTKIFYPESKSNFMSLLDKMNRNLYNDNKDSLYTIKTVLRLMNLCDQLPRWFKFEGQKGFLPHSFQLASDSLNRHILGYLMDNKLLPKFSDLGYDFTTIHFILLHSVLNGNLEFFEKYFTVFVSSMDWGLNYHKDLVDSYLNRTRNTQCFGTWKDILPNGKFDFVPIENQDTINKILLEKLKIEQKYIEEFK